MKSIVLLSVLFAFSFVVCPAQKIIRIEKTPEVKQSAAVDAEISEREWRIVIDALRLEDWDKSAFIASQLLGRVTTDNDKKQLAQLRYIYMYSLAGKIIAYSENNKHEAEAATRRELDATVKNFTGREIIMPPREFIGECKQVLNYICTVKNSDNALRVAATNKTGTSIHSFDYVTFDKKIDLKEFAGKEVFLGGTLAKTEFNDKQSNVWIMRLFFENGFARVVVSK